MSRVKVSVLKPVADWRPGQDFAATPAAADADVVLVSGHFVRSLSLPWSDALLEPASALSYATSRWQQTFGADDQHWQRVLCKRPYGQPCLVLGWPSHFAGQPTEARLITPLFGAALDALRGQLPRNGLFAVVEPFCASIGIIRSGSLLALTHHRFDDDWAQSLDKVVCRLRLRDETMASLGDLHVLALCDDAPRFPSGEGWRQLHWPAATLNAMYAWLGERAGDETALYRRGRRNVAAWAGLAAAAALLVLALVLRWQTPASPANGESRTSDSPPASVADKATVRALGKEVAAVNTLVAQLNFPADALLNAIKPGKDDVSLLTIDVVNAEDGKVRIVASARSIDAARSYLQQLEKSRHLEGVGLSHHEQGSNPDWPYRFTVEAKWLAV